MTDAGDKNELAGKHDAGMLEDEDLLGPELRVVLGSLPKALAPERDLTADIAARTWDSRGVRIDNVAGATTTTREDRSPWWSAQGLKLAAAAVVLVVLTSAVTTVLVRERFDAAATSAGTDQTVAEATEMSDGLAAGFVGYADVETQYAAAIADLTAALASEHDRLPPETVALIEENLRIIDEAIQHSLAALAAAPQSLPLQQAVMTSYERKLDFLRQATAITAEG